MGKNGKLTTKECECQIKEGLCLYCEEKGHIAQDCPKSKAAKAHTATFASTESQVGLHEFKKIVSNPLVQPMWAEGCIDLECIAKFV